jgi:hypothetical protein
MAPSRNRTRQSRRKQARPTKRKLKRAPINRKATMRVAKQAALSLKQTKKFAASIVTRPFGRAPVGFDPSYLATQYATNNPAYSGHKGTTHRTFMDWLRDTRADPNSADMAARRWGFTFSVQPDADGRQTDVITVEPGPKHWEVFLPLAIQKTTSQDSLTQREDNRVYAQNAILEFDLEPSRKSTECFYVRCMMGYYKGEVGRAANTFAHDRLESVYHSHNAKPDPASGQDDSFKITSDTVKLMTPKQVFDLNGSDDQMGTAEHIFGAEIADHYQFFEGEEPLGALWEPYKKKLNFEFKRQFTYQGDDIVGAIPFIAIGVFPTGAGTDFKTFPATQSATGETIPRGIMHVPRHAEDGSGDLSVDSLSHPSPLLTYSSKVYFKDIM